MIINFNNILYTNEQLDNFVKAVLEVMPLHQESQALMIDEIEEIMANYQQDPELQMKVNQIMEEMDQGE